MYAVLFDIDGTLLHTGGAGHLAFAETFADEFGVAEMTGAVPFAGRSDRAIAFDLMNAHGVAATDDNWRRFRETYLKRLPGALDRRQGSVLPGVAALLDALDSLDHSLVGLLTGNVQEGARHKLAYYGLSERFGFGGFGDVSDDRCHIAAAALAEARIAAHGRNGRCNGDALAGVMVIGDTVHDVRCARSIGAVAVAVPTGNTPAAELAASGPDLLLDSLADSQPLLELVRSAAG